MRQCPTPMLVYPSPFAAALASSSQAPNCRYVLTMTGDTASDVAGVDDDVDPDVGVVVVGEDPFGALGRPFPLPWP